MTGTTSRITDDLLHRALAELAAGPDADILLADVIRAVDSRAQVGRRSWDTRAWRRAAVLIATVVLLATAIVGTTVVLTRPQPSPGPTRTPLPLSNEVIRVPDFFAPFSYRVPVGMSGKLQVQDAPDSFYLIRGERTDQGTLVVFPVSGGLHVFPADGGTQQCRPVASEPTTEDALRTFLKGLDEGPISPTTLGDQPALGVAIDPAQSDCRNALFHVHGLTASQLEPSLALAYPGRLIVAATGAGPVGVLINAPSDAALAAWQPVADSLVSGIAFDATALSDRVITVSDFAVKFTYRLPVGATAELEAHGNVDKIYFTDARVLGAGRLDLFPISGAIHKCGSRSADSVQGSTIPAAPAAFLEALRDEAGVGMGPITAATLGNLPAIATDIDPSIGACAGVSLHLNGMGLAFGQYEPALDRPGRLVVASVGGKTIGALISAPNKDALAGALPIAQAYLDGMVFDNGSEAK